MMGLALLDPSYLVLSPFERESTGINGGEFAWAGHFLEPPQLQSPLRRLQRNTYRTTNAAAASTMAMVVASCHGTFIIYRQSTFPTGT